MLTLTESAVNAVVRFAGTASSTQSGVRIAVENGGCSGLQYKMKVETGAADNDTVITEGEARVFIDPESAPMLEGVTLDFLDGLDGTGFKFQNPNATAACNCGKSFAC